MQSKLYGTILSDRQKTASFVHRRLLVSRCRHQRTKSRWDAGQGGGVHYRNDILRTLKFEVGFLLLWWFCLFVRKSDHIQGNIAVQGVYKLGKGHCGEPCNQLGF